MLDLSKGTNENRLDRLEQITLELTNSNNQVVHAIAAIIEALNALAPPTEEEE